MVKGKRHRAQCLQLSFESRGCLLCSLTRCFEKYSEQRGHFENAGQSDRMGEVRGVCETERSEKFEHARIIHETSSPRTVSRNNDSHNLRRRRFCPMNRFEIFKVDPNEDTLRFKVERSVIFEPKIFQSLRFSCIKYECIVLLGNVCFFFFFLELGLKQLFED